MGGKWSSIPQHELRPDSPDETRHGTLRSMSKLERYHEFPTSSRDEALFPCSNLLGIPQCHSQIERLTSLRQHERFPEVPIETRDKPKATHRNLRNTMRFPPPGEKRPNSLEVIRQQSHAPPHNSKGDLTFLRQYKRIPEVPVATRVEPQASC